MLKIIRYFKPFVTTLFLLFIAVIIQAGVSLSLPDYMGKIIDNGIILKDTHYIFRTGNIMLLIALVGAVASITTGYIASFIATRLSENLRKEIFSRVNSFSLIEFGEFSTASLITRSTNDIQQIQQVIVMMLRMILMAPIIGIGAIWKANSIAPNMSWIMVLAVITLLSIIISLFWFSLPKFKVLQNFVDTINRVTRETLSGIRVIRAFGQEKTQVDKFEIANRDLTRVSLFTSRLMVIMQPLMMLIFNITSLAVIWYGAHHIQNSELLIGDMIVFLQYSMQVIFSFLMLTMIFVMIPRASVSADRVMEVINKKPLIIDPNKPDTKIIDDYTISFNAVSYTYPNASEAILKNISFEAKAGKTTAIIGSTGSGKSTLVNLIPRFFDITTGSITIGGKDIKSLTQSNLRDMIGYIPQKGILFSGTIRENMKLGKQEATDAEINSALKMAQAEFVFSLKEGLDTPVAQGGKSVSGGQKQRLQIARTIVKNPPIIIFDDSFSALDFKTDKALRTALKQNLNDKTLLIVAQRIGTIKNADTIVVLDEGRIADIGTHNELIKNSKVYQEIAKSQLSEEELGEKHHG